MSVTSSRPRVRIAAAVVGGAIVAASLVSCSSSAQGEAGDGELTPLTLQTSWIPLVQFGGSYIADSEGYYEDFGVDVEILPGGPDVDGAAALAAGQVDIAMGNADSIARANAEGADLVIIAAGFQRNPLSILSAPDDPITSPEEMEGKKIGVPSGDEAAQSALIEFNDLDASAIESVPVGFDVAPLVSGEVDGIWVFYSEQPISYEEATGEEGVVFLAADYGLDVYAQVYAVRRETLEDDASRAAIEGFLSGEIKGWQEYVENPDLAVDLTVNEYGADGGLSVENQTRQAELQMDLLLTPETEEHGLLWMSEEGIANNIASLEALGVEGADESLFDTSILEAVYDGSHTVE